MAGDHGFQDVFESLKKIMSTYEKEMVLVTDNEKTYYLDTKHMRTKKQALFFGAVTAKKSYVSYHLMLWCRQSDHAHRGLSP